MSAPISVTAAGYSPAVYASAGYSPAAYYSPAASVPAARHVPGAGSAPKLRLTRRGRLVFFGIPLVLVAAPLLGLAGFLNAPAKAADLAADLQQTPAVTVVVQPGESLWAIAAASVPDRDTRDVIAEIVQLNNLDGGRVLPGQQLFVPAT